MLNNLLKKIKTNKVVVTGEFRTKLKALIINIMIRFIIITKFIDALLGFVANNS